MRKEAAACRKTTVHAAAVVHMKIQQIQKAILDGNTAMGMEFGSTRVKAVLIDEDHTVIAMGATTWENRFENGIWTYDLADAVTNMQKCFAALAADVREKYGVPLTTIGSIGISGMMHGLLALDREGVLVTPFRTWRNTMTAPEAEALTALFDYTIPQRWSAAHLYQLMKTEPEKAKRMDHMTTLAGYMHMLLTGERVLGCCEAAGMFPVDGSIDGDPVYVPSMVEKMDTLAHCAGMPWKTLDLLPRVLRAGENAGYLTEEGARLLDPSGTLSPGIPFCPPEGDGGTGMVCTGGLTPGCATVSAGTSTFALFVLDKPLAHANPEVETTVTPCGLPVAEIQSNNGTSELDAWVGIIMAGMEAAGFSDGESGADSTGKEAVYTALLSAAMQGEAGCGGLLAYNYLSGEHLTGFTSGRPLFVRTSDSHLTLQNFMRAQLFSIFAPLAYGYRLLQAEGASVHRIHAHGGLFRTRGAAQPVLAAALHAPVTVSETAGEGGPYGSALLAAYAKNRTAEETLSDYLSNRVFAGKPHLTEKPDAALEQEFDAYLETYLHGLPIERAATEFLHIGTEAL